MDTLPSLEYALGGSGVQERSRSWEEAEVAAQNRSEWRQSVAQCIHLDAGWIKVKELYKRYT